MLVYLGKIRRLIGELYALFFITDFKTFARYVWAIVIGIPAIIRVGDLGPASQKMIGRNYAFTISGKQAVLRGEDFGRATELYARGVYNALPEFRLHDGMGVIVDLGANVGDFTVLAAKFAKKVIAVEADKALIETIRENARLNGVEDKIIPVRAIIGARSGMFADPKIKERFFHGDVPPSILFRELLEKNGVRDVDFVKIDIEGSEFDLFKHEIDSFANVKLISMEAHTPFMVHGNEVSCGDIQELKSIFEHAGFKVWLVDVNGRVVKEIKGQAGYLFAKNLKF
ncbi:MAG: FkbM family methyltransferase [Candidatus Jorgensenbacteria bacterium]|nr:FkbM family methyltransferase [Candidatus Jorgensenbacteria bacterium]